MLFSIITVTYNAEETIEKTIQSVVNQKNVCIEYIIIDGGSTDRTKEIVERYKNSISVFLSEQDEGIYDAMNKGIDIAKGDIIAFMNSGDWYEENILEKIEKFFCSKASADVVYGRVKKMCNNVQKGYVGLEKVENPDDLHIGNIYCHQGLFIKKNLFQIIGKYNTKYKILADYDWNLRAYNLGYQFVQSDLDVAYYLDGGISTTSLLSPIEYYDISVKNLNGRKEYLDEIERMYKIRQENSGIRLLMEKEMIFEKYLPINKEIVVWGVGYNGFLCKQIYEKAGYIISDYIDSSKQGCVIGGITVKSFEHFKKRNNDETTFIITPRRFDIEIKDELIKNGIKKNRIIMFCEFLNEAGDYYLNYIHQNKASLVDESLTYILDK